MADIGVQLLQRQGNIPDRCQVRVLDQELRTCFAKHSLRANTQALRVVDLVESSDQDVFRFGVIAFTIASACSNAAIPVDLLPDPPDSAAKLETWHFSRAIRNLLSSLTARRRSELRFGFPGLVKRRGRRSGGLGGKQFIGDLIERPAVDAFAFPADGNDGEVWPNLLLEYVPGHAQVGGGLADANDARRKAVFHFLSGSSGGWARPRWAEFRRQPVREMGVQDPNRVRGWPMRFAVSSVHTDWFRDLSAPRQK